MTCITIIIREFGISILLNPIDHSHSDATRKITSWFSMMSERHARIHVFLDSEFLSVVLGFTEIFFGYFVVIVTVLPNGPVTVDIRMKQPKKKNKRNFKRKDE